MTSSGSGPKSLGTSEPSAQSCSSVGGDWRGGKFGVYVKLVCLECWRKGTVFLVESV